MKLNDIQYDSSSGLFSYQIGRKKYQISYEFYLDHPVQKGEEVPPDLLEAIQKEDGWNSAYKLALRHATYRMRTRQEVVRRLKRSGIYDQEVIDRVLEKLEKLSLLDDEAYAETYVQEKKSRQAWSRRKIKAKLVAKGIDWETADRALENYKSEEEVANIRENLQRKYGRRDLRDQKEFDRVYRGLLSMGFPYGPSRQILEEAREEAGGPYEKKDF